MPKVTKTKVGQVLLKEVQPNKWRASWVEPLTGRWIRRILPGTTFKEARLQAREINAILAQRKGFHGRLRGSTGHTVSDAILEAVKHTDANARSRKNYLYHSNAFADYLAANAKGVQSWGDVTEQILENYLEHCRRQGKAYDTVRQRILVLKITAKYMARTYQYREVTAGIKVKRTAPTQAEIAASDAILSPVQFHDLTEWFKGNQPMVYVWAMVQGMCGVRTFEIAYARESDFDPKARTLRITATEVHTPKTRYSHRVIPLPGPVAEALGGWIMAQRVRHHDGFLFIPKRAPAGRRTAKSPEARIGVLTYDSVKDLWRKALRLARSAGVEIPQKFTGRLLRSSFVTAMREAGADSEVLGRYIGHAPATLLSERYDQIDLNRLRAISNLADQVFERAGKRAKGTAEAR